MSLDDNVFTAPFVAIGMKTGVSIIPCAVVRRPRRALPFWLRSSNITRSAYQTLDEMTKAVRLFERETTFVSEDSCDKQTTRFNRFNLFLNMAARDLILNSVWTMGTLRKSNCGVIVLPGRASSRSNRKKRRRSESLPTTMTSCVSEHSTSKFTKSISLLNRPHRSIFSYEKPSSRSVFYL